MNHPESCFVWASKSFSFTQQSVAQPLHQPYSHNFFMEYGCKRTDHLMVSDQRHPWTTPEESQVRFSRRNMIISWILFLNSHESSPTKEKHKRLMEESSWLIGCVIFQLKLFSFSYVNSWQRAREPAHAVTSLVINNNP